MNTFFLKIIVLFSYFLIGLNTHSISNPTILFTGSEETLPIGKKIMLLEDHTNRLTIHDIVLSKNFKLSTQDVPNLGITSSSFWVKIEIKNLTDSDYLLLEMTHPTTDELEVYSFSKNNEIKVEKLGEYMPFNSRSYKDPNYIFSIDIAKNEVKTYFMKIRSKEIMQIPLLIGTPKTIFELIKSRDVISGIYFGIMLVMILYNLFIYLTIRDRSYFDYVIYILSVLLTQASIQGYAFQYLWPNFSWLQMHSLIIFPALVGIAGIIFMKRFLMAEHYVPSLIKISYLFYSLYIFAILMSFWGFYIISYKVIDITALGVSIFMLYIPITIYRKGYGPAKFFLIAWIVFLIGIFIFVFKDLGIFPYNIFTRYTMQAGSAIETILLSFALADRINILKKEKEESQAEAFKALKANEDIIKQQNVILDIKVTERTEELQNSNIELNYTLKNLKETQSKLVDAEKMASLGQLTAGIAHEINNPINFVSSSVKPLKRDIDDILSILDKYDELSGDGNIDQKMKEINSLKEKLDFDYLKKEINTLLTGIDDGASRTAEIVKGLRNFSRMDESDLKMTDIHEGIDSSLVLLNSALGGRIDIVKEYGNIPAIECYAGKLNQVFMNILTNASQAINTNKEANGKGTIRIKTVEKGENIAVCIKDTGMGMPEEVKNKIFEPFFTTKDVGEGTGLGLSIVFSIIEAHKGQIAVESETGKGTEFIITLPKIQKS